MFEKIILSYSLRKKVCTTCTCIIICILNLPINHLHTSIYLNFEMKSAYYKKVITVSLSEKRFDCSCQIKVCYIQLMQFNLNSTMNSCI